MGEMILFVKLLKNNSLKCGQNKKISTKNLPQILTKHLTKIWAKPLAKSEQKLIISGLEFHMGG